MSLSQLPTELLEEACVLVAGGAWSSWSGASAELGALRALRPCCRGVAEASNGALEELELKGRGVAYADVGRFPRLRKVQVWLAEAWDWEKVRLVLERPLQVDLFISSDAAARCVASPLHVGRLQVTSLSDEDLDLLVENCLGLQELDARGCDLREPRCLKDLAQRGVKMCLDGCWRLTDEVIDELALCHQARQCSVDLFSCDWLIGQQVEVVILVPQFLGCWVLASIISKSMPSPDFDREPCFHILVRQTTAYNSAVGFSGHVASRIRRRHLRDVREGKATSCC
ncbi:unnamed protein product [Effrenium voratum]|uniref:Uncharacterized protein n=1 Tax=Effrenium voratum TaxID=2562239 RepID=A0AA36JAC8_9DINO|nr:unnamed protein product [Effrenium voratum]CAJ1424966.1 unnamed protein product [Effrenium voratum]